MDESMNYSHGFYYEEQEWVPSESREETEREDREKGPKKEGGSTQVCWNASEDQLKVMITEDS